MVSLTADSRSRHAAIAEARESLLLSEMASSSFEREPLLPTEKASLLLPERSLLPLPERSLLPLFEKAPLQLSKRTSLLSFEKALLPPAERYFAR